MTMMRKGEDITPYVKWYEQRRSVRNDEESV